MPLGLTPETKQAHADPRNRLPFSFTPRFFGALLFGFLFLIPASVSPAFVWWMFLWDALLFAAWCIDLARLPAPKHFIATRTWEGPLILARRTTVEIRLANMGKRPLAVTLVDRLPASLSRQAPALSFHLPARDSASAVYYVEPAERGNADIGPLFFRYRTNFNLAERWAVAPLSQKVSVFPDFLAARSQALYLIRSRQTAMAMRHRRQPGFGREFESLREFRDGDELRNVSWTATARRRQIISRTYAAERSQTAWIVVDAGRLSRAVVRAPGQALALTKLDHAVNAALAFAQVASQNGDRVGLLAYGRTFQQSIAPGRGALHLRRFVEALAHVRGEPHEAGHAAAIEGLLRRQPRRALVVWLTDFAETPATPPVIEYAELAARRHLILFAAITQPDLEAVATNTPNDQEEMYRQAAALEVLERRAALLQNLRQAGSLAIELRPGQVSAALLNEYLRIKDRGLL